MPSGLAAEYIVAGELVIEYTGELVRRPVADAREREYAAASGGVLPRGSCYMFAIDAVRRPHACGMPWGLRGTSALPDMHYEVGRATCSPSTPCAPRMPAAEPA